MSSGSKTSGLRIALGIYLRSTNIFTPPQIGFFASKAPLARISPRKYRSDPPGSGKALDDWQDPGDVSALRPSRPHSHSFFHCFIMVLGLLGTRQAEMVSGLPLPISSHV